MARMKVRNITQGFVDATGFHPIRSSYDYDPDRAGDEYSQKSKPKAKGKKKVKKAATKKRAAKKTAKKNPFPGVPKGRFLQARFNRDGTVSVAVPVKRRTRNAGLRGGLRGGYVVYPSGRAFSTLVKARAAAKKEAKYEGSARVERTRDEKVVARY